MQAGHILAKDLRLLWPPVALVALMLGAYAYFDVQALPRGVFVPNLGPANGMVWLLEILLPIAFYVLVAFAVFEEPLPGDRQFWVTRPYRWPHLLLAKLLFAMLCVNVPLFISDCLILFWHGFPVAAVVSKLLLRQVYLFEIMVLPALTMAAVTRGIAQFLMGWFVLVLAWVCEIMLLSSLVGHSEGGEWNIAAPALLIVTAAAAVLWQYATRRTAIAWSLLLAVTLGLPALLFAFPRSFLSPPPEVPDGPRPSGLDISYALHAPLPNSTDSGMPEARTTLWVPLRVSGIPDGELLRGSGMVEFMVNGKGWQHSGDRFGAHIDKKGDQYGQAMEFFGTGFEALTHRPVDITTRFEFEVVTDRVAATIPITEKKFYVNGVGLCRTFVTNVFPYQIGCQAGLEPAVETDLRLLSERGLGKVIVTFQPSSVPGGLSPVSDVGSANVNGAWPDSKFAFVPHRELAHFVQTLHLHNVVLSKYLLTH